jgi:small subunit ribosomal protein S16
LSFVATKIRLMRLGKIRAPFYRIVVADSRTKREGRVIETIGKYHPKEEPSLIEVDSERAQYWLGVGAQPTEPVAAILRKTGDWQKYKGEAAPAPLLTAAPKTDKKATFEAVAKQAIADAEADAKPRKTAPAKPKKAAEAVAEAPESTVTEPAATATLADAVAAETSASAASSASAEEASTAEEATAAGVGNAPESEVAPASATEALAEAAEAAPSTETAAE